MFFRLSGAGSRGQQSKQGCPDFPLPRHFLQLFRGYTEAFPGQPGDIVPPACPRSSPGSPPGGTCPEHLPGKASRRHPEKMPEPTSMWRSSGSTLSSSRVTELLTLSLRDRPATLRRKLILAACISMSLVESKDGIQHFTFEHNRDYQQVQFKFFDAVESMDPNNILVLLQLNPYHIDSLLQLSDVCRIQEDQETARDLIERALYSFECSFHPVFSLTSGICRLDYRRPENRAFYLVLFKHVIFLEKRGCPRTALEYCKLILSLDPDNDPLCMLLLFDFLCLRCREYTTLIRLYEEWEVHRNLSQLPNFSFSVALSYYHLSQQEDISPVENQQLKQKSNVLLQNALIMFPGVRSAVGLVVFLRLWLHMQRSNMNWGSGQEADRLAKPTVCQLSHVTKKELIVREARAKRGKLVYQSNPVAIYEDYAPEVTTERAKYRSVLAELYNFGYKPTLFFPARLSIWTKDGGKKMLSSVTEAENFVAAARSSDHVP
ncbi:hypothetical protein PO909_032505 [Leuciscus waleckii]